MPELEELASAEYRAQLKAKHAGRRWGYQGNASLPEVLTFARSLGARSVLDYGCGRGALGRWLRSYKIECHDYDPGIDDKDGIPEPADLVVSTDVLEHVEPALLGNVLGDIRRCARLGVYLVIAMAPARELLPDGRNAHLIVEPSRWWLERLRDAGLEPFKTVMPAKNRLLCWIRRGEAA